MQGRELNFQQRKTHSKEIQEEGRCKKCDAQLYRKRSAAAILIGA